MSVEFRETQVEALAGRAALRVRFRLENRSEENWSAADGYAVSYQVFDPETDALIEDGPRRPLASDLAPGQQAACELEVELPDDTGRYRVFVSLLREPAGWHYMQGEPFVLIDAQVAGRRLASVRTRITTRTALGVDTFLRSVARAFHYPLVAVWRHRGLIRSMVGRDIHGRYRGSFGGMFWTVLNPLLLMITYFFVFGIVLRARFGNDPSRAGFALYFLAGMLPWLPFAEAAGRAPFVILEHRNFVKKLVFPVEILPVNLVLAGLVTELFALAIFAAGLLAARGAVPVQVLWLPVLLVPQLLFTAGVSWLLAALGVYVRDLGQVNGFLLTLWFFLTPICYPVEALPREALPVLERNPLFVLVAGYRAIFLEHQPPAFAPLSKLWLVALAAFFLGHAFFYRLKKNFADVI